jgi:hypothetical protein
MERMPLIDEGGARRSVALAVGRIDKADAAADTNVRHGVVEGIISVCVNVSRQHRHDDGKREDSDQPGAHTGHVGGDVQEANRSGM